jgi:FkbM family methyltransferase
VTYPLYGDRDDNQLRTPRGNPAVLAARDGTSDLSVIGSTFAGVAGSGLVDEYGLADTYITGRFVDVGAHIGSVTVAVLLDNPDATAICVEPIPENVTVLRENLRLNGLEARAEVIEGAVGTDVVYYNFRGTEHLETNRYIANSTGIVFGERTASDPISVRKVALRELLPADAMKLDCEGGEWALFRQRGLARVPLIFGEYHFGEGQAGVTKALGKSHAIEFNHVGSGAGNFRAVAR